jgi:putative ABC transport system substrate-binding protein
MRRRDILSSLGLGAVFLSTRASPSAAQAAMPTIGFLALGVPDAKPWFAGAEAALREAGYVDGRTMRIERRSAGGDSGRLGELAADLVRLKVDAIVAFQTPAATAARRATAAIPIVMRGVGDPVATGLIASLSHPGGNLTGMSAASPGLSDKLVDIVRELFPAARRLGLLLNGADPYATPLREHIQQGAARNGMEIQVQLARPQDDFQAILQTMGENQAEAVFVQPTLVSKALVETALQQRLPLVSNSGAPLGVLAALAPGSKEQDRGMADYVDKILKGRKPADLPVSQPTVFTLQINSRTAATLGLTIPPAILARADEVID